MNVEITNYAEAHIEAAIETFGRQEWFNVEIMGPVVVGHSADGTVATLRWRVHHDIRHHKMMSRTTPIGMNAYFSMISNAGITGTKDWSSDPGRLRDGDPVRRLEAVPGGAMDRQLFLEVGWRGGWMQSNRCTFDTFVTVSGMLIIPVPREIEIQIGYLKSLL